MGLFGDYLKQVYADPQVQANLGMLRNVATGAWERARGYAPRQMGQSPTPEAQLVAQPVDTARGLFSVGQEIAADPAGSVERGLLSAGNTLSDAIQDPAKMGRLIGENIDLQSVVRGLLGGAIRQEISAAEKAAKTRAEKILQNKGVQHREALREGNPSQVTPLVSLLDQPIIDPQSLQGRALVPVVADNARTGVRIDSLSGVPIPGGTLVQGGPRYSQLQAAAGSPSAWASDRTAATALQRRLEKASEQTGKPAIGVYWQMSPDTGMNFSVPPSDLIAAALPSLRVDPEVIKSFDATIQKKYPSFKGILHPETRQDIRENLPGNARTLIAETASDAKYQNAGFPRTDDILAATREPGLIGARHGHTGYSMFESSPGQPLVQDFSPDLRHETYSTGIPGRYMGQLESAGDMKDVMPSLYARQEQMIKDAAARTKKNRAVIPGNMQRSLNMNPSMLEIANQKWVDEQMTMLEARKRLGLLR